MNSTHSLNSQGVGIEPLCPQSTKELTNSLPNNHTSQKFSPWMIKLLLNLPARKLLSLSQFPSLLKARLCEGEYYYAALLIKTDGAFTHYKETGEIEDELLPFFNQNGTWDPMWAPGDKENFPPIRKEVVPTERITRKNHNGDVDLLTSLHQRDTRSLEIPFHSILGNLHAPYVTYINAPELTTIEGRVYIRTCCEFNAPHLNHTGGCLDSSQAKKVMVPNLTYAGDYLAVGSEEVVLEKLRFTAGNFHAPKAKKLIAPNLVHIGGALEINDVKVFHAPRLKEVAGPLPKHCLKYLEANQLFKIQKTTWDTGTLQMIHTEIDHRHIKSLNSVPIICNHKAGCLP